ncbi:unnamed protein product, partial [Mycena citricolor]
VGRRARGQGTETEAQLEISQADVDALIAQTRETAIVHSTTAQELALQRHSLADELSYLHNQLTSAMSVEHHEATLLEDIETLHRNLQELESVRGYVQVIHHALQLSDAACEQIRSGSAATLITMSSVSQYQALQDFVANVSGACSNIEDGSTKQKLHLVIFLEKIRDKCWLDMKGLISARLLEAAEKIGWPMPVDYVSAASEDRADFERAFRALLKLQTIGENLHLDKDGLYPLQALVQPLSLRFKYHFEGSRQTNRLDKPEWYFTHILNAIHDHKSFLESVVQPLLSTTTEYRDIDASREFTLLLLPILARKLRRSMASLLPHPALLAHTIYQALVFDDAVREDGFALAHTTTGSGDWPGICDVILGREEWFSAWLEGERQFTEHQYEDLISSSDAWQIADDDGEGSDAKTTNSSRRLKALVEQVTDRYSPLPHFAHRTRFLIAVQIPLLENYQSRVSSSLDAFETLSSAFVRAVPGALSVSLGGRDEGSVKVDARRLTDGVEGVQRLAKAWLSAKFMIAAMKGWGEDLFFLELWTEINHRPALRAQVQHLHCLPEPSAVGSTDPEDAIFDELVGRYDRLAIRAEDMIVLQICGEVEGGLRAHFSSTQSPNPNDDIALSQSLLSPLAVLSTLLKYLQTILPLATLTVLYRRIAARLAEHIFQRQIMYRGQISTQAGKAIHAECEIWVQTCQAVLAGSLSRTRVEAPWLTLLTAGRVVGLDGEAWDKLKRVTFGTVADSAWTDAVLELIQVCELPREEVQKIVQCREG